MEQIFLIVFFIVLCRALYSNIMFTIVLIWLKSNRLEQSKRPAAQTKKFIIIIPVLREQKILKNTLNYFLSMNYPLDQLTLMIVSTEKELADAASHGFSGPTTVDLITKLKKTINQKLDQEIIVHLHYPLANGKMVHQINYAFGYILRNYKKKLDNLFVSIYNADSRPSLDTFSVIASLSKKHNLRVFQQSALFFDNLSTLKSNNNFLVKRYLMANAVLHSRWTMAHEIPRLLRQSFWINHFRRRFFLSHCVGHGLFLRGDFLQEIKAMPDTTVTEDLFFGYVLSLLGESINPVPVLEMAEAPTTISAALKQKYVWFFGPLDHFSYEKFAKKNFSDYTQITVMRWLTLQGIIPAIAWLLMGWLFIFVLIYPIAVDNYRLFGISCLLVLFYGPLSYCLVLFFSQKLNKICYISCWDYFWLACFSLPAAVLHSLPPIFTILTKLNYFFTKQEPRKPKTER